MGTIDRFYTAFARHDGAAMAACYADDATFNDPVFSRLDADGARAMWRMLLAAGPDLRVTHRVLEEGAGHARCRWEARYTFGPARRPVHNIVHAEFVLRDGLIVRHRDRFPFWRWSRQALGATGLFFGWTPLLRRSVQRSAARSLARARGAA